MSARTGIDLGTGAVKLVRGEGRLRLERITHLEIEDWGPVDAGDAAARAAGALGRILSRLGGARRRLGKIAVGVGGEESGIREVQLPLLTEDEVRRALPFESRKHLTLEDMVSPTVAFQVLGTAQADEEGGAMQTRVLLAAVSAPQREFPLRVLSDHGLTPEVIDLEPLANLNALLGTLPEGDLTDRVVGVLDLGAQQAGLYVTQQDGRIVTRVVGPGVPEARAAVASYIEGLTRRIQETLTFYRGRYRRDVTSLHVAGGGALLDGICHALQSALSLPVSALNPLQGIGLPAAAGDELARQGPRFATACGLCRWWDGTHV